MSLTKCLNLLDHYSGHFEIVKLLIANGIDYSVKYTGENMKDMDALTFAHERGQAEIESFLQALKNQ